MRILMSLVDEPMVRAFGWSLLHFVWEGAVVAGLLAVALKVLSGRSACVRYGFACGALVLMAVLPVATCAYLLVTMHSAGRVVMEVSGQRIVVMGIVAGAAGDSWVGELEVVLDRMLPWILAMWFAGVVLFVGRLNVGLMVAWRMKSLGTQAVAVELQQVFFRLKAGLGVSRPVRLVQSARVQVPTVIGWLRPVVLIPVGCLMGLSPVQIEAIFAHELAHIRRHDYLVSVLQSVVESVLFYHPAVWWVSRQVRKECEHCCDDLAVRSSGNALAYAKALSLLEEKRSTYPAVSLGANGGALAMRIKRLLGYKDAPAYSQLVGSTLLVTMVAGIAMSVVTIARGQFSADKRVAEQEAAEEASVPPMYRKWLDEDVFWIITPEERAKYLRLENDDERNEFIKQFWERRNVAGPAKDGNAYRAEYYRRIAYANQHFAAGVPGWKSDRGRIYILYGNPDSIDSHPVSVGEVKPVEVWHYNVLQEYSPSGQETAGDKAMTVAKKGVDMKFVDTCNCGNFQLQASPK